MHAAAPWCRTARRAGLLMALALATAGAAQAQTEAELIERARLALGARDPAAALDALDAAERARGAPGGHAAQFLRGTALQDRARQLADPAEQARALAQAQAAYTRALETAAPGQPKGALLNNLALLAASQGEDAAARRWFGAALQEPDARSGRYANNYVRYLETRDPDAAVQLAARALAGEPDNPALRSALGRLYARDPADERLPALLQQSVEQGYTGFAIATGLQELATRPERPLPVREQLLLAVADALVREVGARPPGAEGQADGAPAARLQALAGDAQLGPAAATLAAVLRAPPESFRALGWWTRDRPAVGTPARTPKTVMRELLVVLGTQAGVRRPPQAEQWLRAAIDGGDRGPDPDAFLRTVELYANSEQPQKLKPLMQRYEWDLFSEKSASYARGDWPSIYRLHLALGMTYAQMQVWESATPFQNAIFQLQRAGEAAERINRMPPPVRKSAQPVTLPPVAALKLAEGYRATGKPYDAARVKLDTADQLQKLKRNEESAQLLQALEPAELNALKAPELKRYRELKSVGGF